MSESFYEIKEGLTKEHKKYLAELKTTYDESKKNLQREEKEAVEKRDKILHELKEYSIEVKKALAILDEARKEEERIGKKIEVFKKEKADWDILRAREEDGFREHTEWIVRDTEKLDKKSDAETKRIELKEKDLLKIQGDSEQILKRNEIVLSSIKKVDKDLTIKIQQFEKTKQETENSQDKLTKNMKENSELLEEIKTEKEKKRQIEEKVDYKLAEANRKIEFVLKRDKELDEREKKLDDRDISQNFREIETNNREDRVRKLIEIHKLEVK